MPEIVSEDKLQKYVLNHLSKLNQNADPDKCGSRIIGMKSAFKKYGLFALLFFWGGGPSVVKIKDFMGLHKSVVNCHSFCNNKNVVESNQYEK